MKATFTIITIGIIFLGTSCKSLKTLTSKDTSTSSQTVVKRKQKNVTFIETIEVTPGTAVTSKHTTINTSNAKKQPTKTQSSTAKKTDTTPAKSTIENASELQLKYALLLDATVEKLDNIPLLQAIDHWLGTRYCLGGSTENCIDCSAFTQALLKTVYNIQLSRTAQEQFNNSESIDMSELREGDLVFFNTSGKRRITHVGYYLMNNKFVHASTSNGVMISDLNDTYWKQHYKASGRVKN